MASRVDIDTRLQHVFSSLRLTDSTVTSTYSAKLDPSSLPSFRIANFVGEALTRLVRESKYTDLMEYSHFNQSHTEWLANGKHVIHMYGPSEAVCGFTMENPVRSSRLDKTPVGFSVGRETSVYIMLSNMSLAPVGCIGEIYASGPTVGMGYFGDEKKTKTCFVQDPFRPHFKMYKTGDLGWYESCDFIDVRLANQIRIGSIMKVDCSSMVVVTTRSIHEDIELNQVCIIPFTTYLDSLSWSDHLESVLRESHSSWKIAASILELDGVQCAAIFLARELAIGANIKDIELSLTDEARAQVGHLKKLAQSMLSPAYMPEVWVPVRALPCTKTGKLNRRLMREFFHSLSFEVQSNIVSILKTEVES